MFNDILKFRDDFPALNQTINGKPLVYFDNAATTLKPQCVIDKINDYYTKYTANVHRGVHSLSEKATFEYENARKTIKNYLNAESENQIIFTRGTTDSINMVASTFGRQFIKEDDEILITEMEHHSNIVPWQLLAETNHCKLKIAPINDSGELMLEEFEKLITERTKLISVVYISNSLGTVNPVERIIQIAHSKNIPVLVDAAQTISHKAIDVQALDCDFLAISGHKVFGPTGIGVLYGKSDLLNKMPPYQGGGDMISSVTFEKTTFNSLPYKFEAGTPNIAGAIGFGEALNYVKKVGITNIAEQEAALLEYGTRKLSTIDGLKLIGTAKNKTSILSFVLPEIHAHDMGTLLDEEGIAIRTGHHCTQPVMKHFNVPATSRASLAFYNTTEEIDKLCDAILKAKKIFSQ